MRGLGEEGGGVRDVCQLGGSQKGCLLWIHRHILKTYISR